MDVSHILDSLNEDQRNAVTSEKQHLLVLAGAGSGKTRVLVHKIAWEVEALGRNPSAIMAVTFTNKAANEMRSRIEELLQSPFLILGLEHFMACLTNCLRDFIRRQNSQVDLLFLIQMTN